MPERDLVVGGIHAVRTALELAPHDALELWLRPERDSPVLESIAALAQTLGLTAHPAELRTLDRLCGDSHHQGVVLRRRVPANLPLHALLQRFAGNATVPLLLVLDGVQDPRNFGACLRAADGAGVDAVVSPRDKSAPLSSVVAKAASGAIDSVALVTVTNLASALTALAEAGIWNIGTAHDAPTDLYGADFSPPAALVLGGEGRGMRRLTRMRCDTLVRIPMHGRVQNLNVATAAAIGLFEARRQRSAGSHGGAAK